MTRVLIVSKPLVPPWNDSGKNVARDLVTYSSRTHFRVFTARGAPTLLPPSVECLPIYRATRTFGPRLLENARVAFFLARDRSADIVHYFFAPNRTTSTIARVIATMKRSQKTVQTVLSAPRDATRLLPNLFADRVVAVSRHRARQIPGSVCIPPGIPIGAAPTDDDRRAARQRFRFLDNELVVVYAGDLEFSNAARLVAASVPRLTQAGFPVRVVFACRTKTTRAKEIDVALRAEFASLPSVLFAGEVDGIRELLLAGDVTLLPADDTYAKIDLPLVLLESLEVGTPIVVGKIEPLIELLGGDGVLAVDPHDPTDLVATLRVIAMDPARRHTMRAAARTAATTRFDARQMAAAYEALYAELSPRGVQVGGAF